MNHILMQTNKQEKRKEKKDVKKSAHALKTSRVHSCCCSDTCIIRYSYTGDDQKIVYSFNGDVTPIPILSF